MKIWKTRKLTLEVKMVYFKAVVISKFAFQSFTTTSQNKLEKKAFFWNNSTPKIKHETTIKPEG